MYDVCVCENLIQSTVMQLVSYIYSFFLYYFKGILKKKIFFEWKNRKQRCMKMKSN